MVAVAQITDPPLPARSVRFDCHNWCLCPIGTSEDVGNEFGVTAPLRRALVPIICVTGRVVAKGAALAAMAVLNKTQNVLKTNHETWDPGSILFFCGRSCV